jgi:hypothetical protein
MRAVVWELFINGNECLKFLFGIGKLFKYFSEGYLYKLLHVPVDTVRLF